MIIRVDTTGTPEAFRSLLEDVVDDETVQSVLVLACAANGFTPESVDDTLASMSIPLFGGVFPAVIHGREKLERGTIVAGMRQPVDVAVIPNLSDPTRNFDTTLSQRFGQLGAARTMFVMVDGYAKRISDLIDNLYNILGLGLTYVGGGAGAINPNVLDMQPTPCLLSNAGLVKDSALLVTSPLRTGIGVEHGWSKLSGPYKVTKSDKNVIRTLDWEPAFDLYKRVVEEHSHHTLEHDNFFYVAKSFPFGISRMESQIIVRDPFAVDDAGNLLVAAEIPDESFVDILTGDHDSLVHAAGVAAERASKNFGPQGSGETVLLIDCISRALFLGDSFGDEIDAVYDPKRPLIGFLSLGEIAGSGANYMELYNKTAVVGVLGD